MLLKEVAYYRPETIEAAIEMLRSNPDARILAGGQSLLNVMKHRIASPEVLVDLGGMPELSYVEVEEDSSVEIGAMTTYDDLDRSEQLRRSRPVVAEVASGLVDQQVRNRGTIGGNLCYSDPTSNLPPLMVALEASLVVAGPGGVREVSAEDFFRGPYFTDLRSGEVLTAVRVPPSEHGEGDGYASLRLSAHGWGLAHAATVVRLADGEVAEARISLGCVADRPVRATQMEEALRGRRPTEEALREATEVVEATLDPITDVHATGSYRAKMAGVVARRAVEQAVERTGGLILGTRKAAPERILSVTLKVNGEEHTRTVEARNLLVFFLRDDLGLTGTHVGCDTGNCGACTVVWNGKLVKSCMMLAAQVDGSEILTVEGLAPSEDELHPVQRAFSEHHGLQCGYCTPGMLIAAKYLLERNLNPSDEEIRRGLKGNICRCTGYENIVAAVRALGDNENGEEAR